MATAQSKNHNGYQDPLDFFESSDEAADERSLADQALRSAVLGTSQGSAAQSGDRDPSLILERIREAGEAFRLSSEHASRLQASLDATRELAGRDATTAQERIRSAEDRAEAEAARADAAERRLREAEDLLANIMGVINDELTGSLPRSR